MKTKQQHPFFWVVLFLAATISSLYIFAATVIYQYGHLDKDLGWEYGYSAGKAFVVSVDPGGPVHETLRPGDRILTINGNAPMPESEILRLTVLSFPGESYTMRIARNGEQLDLPLQATIRESSEHFWQILIPALASLVMFTIAVVIGFAKPDERPTQLFTLTWCSVALIFLGLGFDPFRNLLSSTEANFHTLIWLLSFSPIEAAIAYHFCYRFPPGIPQTRFWSVLKTAFYIFAGLLTLAFTAVRIGILKRSEGVIEIFSTYPLLASVLERSSDVLMVVALFAMAALIIRNHLQIREVNERRKLRWVAIGTLVGLIPSLIFFVAKFSFSHLQWNSGFTRQCLSSMMLTSDLFLVLVPITIGYAIIKHRIFDIQVVVRQGIRYLFAKNVIRIFTYLPAIIIVLAIIRNRDQSITELIFSNTTYIIITSMALIGLKFRNRLADWLDRKFFREAYNSEKILVSLIDEVKSINSMSEISRWVTLQLDSALHPKHILVFYQNKQKGDLALGHSSGGHSQDLRIAKDSGLVRLFTTSGSAHKFPSAETEVLSNQEQEWLHQLNIHLIVPMNDSDQRLIGLLLLGEKKSEQPYTANDRKMLEALAGQISMVCENLLLKEHVDSESKVKRQVLDHLSAQNRNLLKECPVCGRCYDFAASACEEDGTELVLTLPVERVIDEKYRLNKLLGRGGMGAVYEATDLRLNRAVAVKILVGSMFGDRLALRRFEREARTSAQLNHPNVVSVYDFGAIAGEGAYLVMELIHGFTLRYFLDHEGNVPPALAADWFDQMLEGMKAAHLNGIVHRDLKPENILISRKGKNESVVKILDFGLAKLRFIDQAESKNLTVPGTVVGTLSYMSPEQIVGADLDERTDIFSLGVMAIEALTGQQPFKGNTPSDVAMAIISRAVDLEGDSDEVRKLNGVIQKAIAKTPQKRYKNLSVLQKDLVRAIRDCPPFPPSLPKAASVGSHAQTRISI